MERLGRPSAIFGTLYEARCATCGTWIRAPLLRLHRESAHPREMEQAGGELREIPIPARIAEYVETGVYLEHAAAACGIPRRTVMRWMEIGRMLEEELGPEEEAAEIPAERRIFWHFWHAVTRARDASKARHHGIVERASETDWKAAAWILERTAPDKYGRQERLRIGGDAEAGPIRVVHEQADPDFIQDVMQIYRRAGLVPDVDSDANTNGHSPKED